MSKVNVGLLQVEIEEAIKKYVGERLNAGYEFEFSELQISFDVSDMDGRISCQVSTMINPTSAEITSTPQLDKEIENVALEQK